MRRVGWHLSVAVVLGMMLGAGGTMAADAKDEVITLPSGMDVTLQEMIWDQPGGGLVYRFRFVAPGFDGGAESFETLMQDLEFLCTSFALPRIADLGPQPRQVVVSLADRASEFGVYDPEVTQIFEAYRVENGACIWEMF